MSFRGFCAAAAALLFCAFIGFAFGLDDCNRAHLRALLFAFAVFIDNAGYAAGPDRFFHRFWFFDLRRVWYGHGGRSFLRRRNIRRLFFTGFGFIFRIGRSGRQRLVMIPDPDGGRLFLRRFLRGFILIIQGLDLQLAARVFPGMFSGGIFHAAHSLRPAGQGQAEQDPENGQKQVLQTAHGYIIKKFMSPTQEKLSIRRAQSADLKILWDMVHVMNQAKDTGYFERQMEYQDRGEREILIIAAEGRDAGYCILNWRPKYGFFKKLEIPEIQDLNVLPEFRRRGIASFLIAHCEAEAVKKSCAYMGISVALNAAYGPAQILYTKLGYVPDGNGVTYDRAPVMPAEIRPVDDHLCLMMVKAL